MKTRVVDTDVLENLVLHIGAANMRIVVAKVQREVPVLWQELIESSRDRDNEATERHLHVLATVFRSVGLIKIADALVGIEMKLRVGESVDPVWISGLEEVKHVSMEALSLQLEREFPAVAV